MSKKAKQEKRRVSAKIGNFLRILSGVFSLVRPYGRKKLFCLGAVIVVQAFAQMMAVAGLFPFLNVLVGKGEEAGGLGGWLTGLVPIAKGMSPLAVSGLLAVVILLVANAVGFYAGWMRSQVSWQISHFLRSRLMRRMMSRPYEWHTRQNSSVLAKKALSDCQLFTVGVLIPFFESVSSLFLMLTLGVFVVLLDWRIGLLGVGGFGVVYLFFFWGLNPFRTRISNGMKVETRDVFQRVGEIFSGFKLVTVYGKEKMFLERVEKSSWSYCELATKSDVLKMSSRFVIEPLIAISIVGLLFILERSEGGVMEVVPTLGVSALALLRLLPAFRSLYANLSSISSSRYTYQEIRDELMEEEKGAGTIWSEEEGEVFEEWNEVRFEKVDFCYAGVKEPVLKGLSFRLKKGTSLAVEGPSGSGKSTTVDLLMGLLSKTGGEILLDGRPLEGREMVRRWQRRIGYVSQDGYLIDGTIEDNIAFGIQEDARSREQIRKVAKQAQISGFVEKELPKDYETWVGERGVRLSGGQRQRILLARALYIEPEVLILDEATSALDEETETRFLDTVFELGGGLTIVLISHDRAVSRRAKEVLDLKRGEMIVGS